MFVGGTARLVTGSAGIPLNTWTHLAVTYDGTTERLYVNGTQAGTLAAAGTIAPSNGVLRIGGNNIWSEWFQGRIDEVRVYNRALTAAELGVDMTTGVANDTKAPTVVAAVPAGGAIDVPIALEATFTFSEAMDPATVTPATIEVRDSGGTLVPAAVSYDPLAAKATLTSSTALIYGTSYTLTVKGGASGTRVKDAAGNALAANFTVPFTTEPPPPPILLVTGTANPYSSWAGEILRAEGLNEFATVDVSLLSPAFLNFFDTVVLGDVALSAGNVTLLTNWVNAGGNLIAFSPDKQLAGLLGLTDAGTTLTNGYLLVNTASGPGAGIVGQTMQFHGSADRYTLNGATSLATLYSNATTATANPAVTLRSVGASGGQAAAFTYDLARSIVLTRQGNPAWVGQDRDGVVPIRTNDLFYGAMSGDVQPDWVDLNKLAIPQADEQQRLLANLVTSMTRDRKPLPRFWYLPNGEKAALVMTGDDHGSSGTAGRFNAYKAASAAGCSVVAWECIRSTSYIYDSVALTNAQAVGFTADGFEVAVHIYNTDSGACGNWTPTSLATNFTTQYGLFAAKYPTLPAPTTERTHCVAWTDWATHAKLEAARGVRLDTNYYHYPGSWVGTRPGLLTGSAMLMRFADVDGTPIDVYQGLTQMTDESGQTYPSTSNTLLDKAVGSDGYFGFYIANAHTDYGRLRRQRRDHRVRGRPQHPGDQRQAGARLDGRTQQLQVPRVRLGREHAYVPHHARHGDERARGHAPHGRAERPPLGPAAQRIACLLFHPDRQGSRVRDVPCPRRHLLRGV